MDPKAVRKVREEDIKQVAVIGAGVMGHSMAQVFAQGGCSVALCDTDAKILGRAIERIRGNLRLYIEVGLETAASAETVLSRIRTTTDLPDAVEGAEFVTEAVLEEMDLKKQVFKEIDAVTDSRVVMASNTSGLSMTEIGKEIEKSDKLITTHWFNPPHLIPVVEVVKAEQTSDETFDMTFEFLKRMGKVPVHVRKEVPGFLVNRIQTAMFREIVGLLEAGVASAEDIDKAVQGSFGLRLSVMGPLTVVDFAGVHLWYKGAQNLYPLFDDSKEPQRLLADMVEKNFLGERTGKGFFEYRPEQVSEMIKARDLSLLRILKVLKEAKAEDGK